MGWGEPKGPTTGELERIDRALTEAGIPTSDDNGYPISLVSRVKLALRRLSRSEMVDRFGDDAVLGGGDVGDDERG